MYLNDFPQTALSGLEYITKRQHLLLERLGVKTVADAFNYFPFRYNDRSKISSIEESILKKEPVTTVVQVIEHGFIYFNGRRHPKILVQDEQTRAYLVGFNREYLKKSLKIGEHYWVFAQFIYKYNEIQASSFDFEEYKEGVTPKSFGAVLPVYQLTEGLFLKELRGVLKKIFDHYRNDLEDELPAYILNSHHLVSKREALENIHFPADGTALGKAKLRLAYEEFLAIQLAVMMKRQNIRAVAKNHGYENKGLLGRLLEKLPYRLTGGQDKAMKEVLEDMDSKVPMHRLLQGDVGSGKTTVAAAALIYAAGNGYQSAIMAPTEVLAVQHYETLRGLFEPLGILILLLSGSMTAAEKDEALKLIKSGVAQVVIGTHALIQEAVAFKKLTCIVFDEQHKFGVEQRIQLAKKGENPDILVMTATPIPRTLTLTVYGDLDVSIIDELPANRKPIKTKWFTKKDYSHLLAFVESELSKGRQAYFVYPLIEESEKIDTDNAVKMAATLQKHYKNYKVGLLHGRMSSQEKADVMAAFRDHRLDLLTATTVVEVGIDVKNATVMVIEGADRFGLSQLHQLRGRVGRGEQQSYCALVTGSESGEDTQKRMEVMVQTNDGFKIAEEDLKLRGPGEILGVRQSGLPELKIADYLRDEKLFLVAKQDAANILKKDPGLAMEANKTLRDGIIRYLPADYLYSG